MPNTANTAMLCLFAIAMGCFSVGIMFVVVDDVDAAAATAVFRIHL